MLNYSFMGIIFPPCTPKHKTRHKAQQERRAVLLERRKQFRRELRLQEKEVAAARAISAQAREAYHERELASSRLKKAADEKESRRYCAVSLQYGWLIYSKYTQVDRARVSHRNKGDSLAPAGLFPACEATSECVASCDVRTVVHAWIEIAVD